MEYAFAARLKRENIPRTPLIHANKKDKLCRAHAELRQSGRIHQLLSGRRPLDIETCLRLPASHADRANGMTRHFARSPRIGTSSRLLSTSSPVQSPRPLVIGSRARRPNTDGQTLITPEQCSVSLSGFLNGYLPPTPLFFLFWTTVSLHSHPLPSTLSSHVPYTSQNAQKVLTTSRTQLYVVVSCSIVVHLSSDECSGSQVYRKCVCTYLGEQNKGTKSTRTMP